ncbi:hypothetical protein QYE76_027917 [Lolium multiflorum]|uniref:DUF4220 domain-containing protein n=1 Tax=Lolium multiflorum TaxID=4521 RepID=A0AAD8QNB0_LOLMU|nr:hypothetical protein QYE76_027917 [Lolium multiflorum]
MASYNAASSPNTSPAPYTSPSQDADDIVPLVYITVFMSLGVLAQFLLHVLGSLRRRSSNKALHAIVSGAYTLSYLLVSYSLGLMQDSKKYFEEFAVWAVCLLMLLGGTDNLMACKLDDVDNWKSFHTKHLFKGVVVVLIVIRNGGDVPQYQKPLWGILCVNILQSFIRIKSMRMASKSNLLSKNVKPISDYMKGEDNEPEFSAATMKGYKYIVAGEHSLRNHGKEAGVGGTRSDKNITTVEQIYECEGSLLSSMSRRGMWLKDICLSMALSKMLNRRFAGFELGEVKANPMKTSDFVFKGLVAGDNKYERAFRVIEVELGFVYDLYYTRYPFLYQKFRYFALCLPVAMVTFCSFLTNELFKKYKSKEDNEDNKDNYIPLTATLCLMSIVTFLEALQLYLHMASDWFKVALIRGYVTGRYLQRSGCFCHFFISLVFRLKAPRPWENKLGQYSLLDKYNGTRHRSNCCHYITLFLVDRAKKGRERGDLVKLSIQVKQAVIDSLIGSKGQLTNGAKSLEDNGVHGLLLWACATSDEMVIHSILVWHVATTICKHQLDAELAKGGKKIAALSVEDSSAAVDITGPSVQDSSAVASSLSQYCAYLIAFAPDLLPGHSFDSESILDQSIKDARKFPPLKGTKKMDQKCEKLLIFNPDDNYDHPVAQGAQLARKLMDIQDMAKRWKVLSEFWAEMMLYIAPCDDGQVRAHLEALARGGEFITHLWALLTHAGVLKRPPTGSEAA